ncbi:MAG: hypothetical protein WCK37_05005 [Candidatus Falkowbacteria bacterium]
MINNEEEIIINTKSCSGGGCADKKGAKCCDNGGACGGGGCADKKTESANISELNQWPIKLHLIDPDAPYFKEADILIAADCAPFAYANFHEKFLKGRKLIIFCPKLDNGQDLYVEKLTELFVSQNIRTLTLVRMEAPCCDGFEDVVVKAIEKSGVNVLVKLLTLSLKGEIVA